MTQSNYTLEGVSSLTVRQGGITLFLDVEDFTVVADRTYKYYDPTWSPECTYAIKECAVVVDDEGTAFKIVKAQKPVTRTVSIEIDEWSMEQITTAQSACGAPERAVPTWVRDGGKQYVEFKWEDNV